MEMTIQDLSSIFDKIVFLLNSHKLDNLKIGDDLYWSVPSNKLYNIIDEPELNIGSLFDDIISIKEIIVTNQNCTYLDLDRVANILKAISQMQNPI